MLVDPNEDSKSDNDQKMDEEVTITDLDQTNG